MQFEKKNVGYCRKLSRVKESKLKAKSPCSPRAFSKQPTLLAVTHVLFTNCMQNYVMSAHRCWTSFRKLNKCILLRQLKEPCNERESKSSTNQKCPVIKCFSARAKAQSRSSWYCSLSRICHFLGTLNHFLGST